MIVNALTAEVTLRVDGVDRIVKFHNRALIECRAALGLAEDPYNEDVRSILNLLVTGNQKTVLTILAVGMKRDWPEATAEALANSDLTINEGMQAMTTGFSLALFGTEKIPERPLETKPEPIAGAGESS